MECINYSDIDFDSLKRLYVPANSSDLYVDEDNKEIYKIFYENFSSDKIEKLKSLEKIKNIDFLVVPHTLIIKDEYLRGCVSKYIDGITLSKLSDKISIYIFTLMLINISRNLEHLHNIGEKVVVGDFHTKNIEIDENLKHYFIDTDSYGILSYSPETYSNIIYRYYRFLSCRISYNINMDKISLLFSLFEQVFNRHIIDISSYDFASKMEKFPFLENFKPVYLQLLYSSFEVPNVPYLHEIIDENNIIKSISEQDTIDAKNTIKRLINEE